MVKKITLYLSVIISLLVLPFQSVSAFSISPLRQAVSIEPGNEKNIEVEVKNNSKNRKKFKPQLDTFQIDAEGNIKYEGDSIAEQWILYDKNPFILDPNEKKNVNFSINVPKQAKPESHYLVLFIKEVGIDAEISASARNGSLLFLHVAGKKEERMTIDRFFSDKHIYFGSPINISIEARNRGSIHVAPTGRVSLSDGQDVIDKKNINDGRQIVLPKGKFERTYSFSDLGWKNTGQISAVAYMKYGRTSKSVSKVTKLWYLPKQVLFFTGAILLAIFLLPLIFKRYVKFNK
ncbi:MAG: hypothetical protein ABEJ02_03420 [Candidatus Paceibacteria bacterium]